MLARVISGCDPKATSSFDGLPLCRTHRKIVFGARRTSLSCALSVLEVVSSMDLDALNCRSLAHIEAGALGFWI